MLASGTKSLIAGLRPSVRFPRRTVPSWVKRADRLRQSALDGFQPGDERGRYRAHAGNQNSQFAFGGRNLDVVLIGQMRSP